MFYIIHGADVSKARAALRAAVDGLLVKKPDAPLIFIEGDKGFSPEELEGYIAGQGLFEKNFIVVFDGVLKNEETLGLILARLPDIAQTPNVFFLLEEKISSAPLKEFSALAEKVLSFEKSAAVPPFNVFSLTDALGRRDRKGLWILYRKAKQAGLVDEEMHGTLLWQVRTMLLSRVSRDGAQAGLKPFVFLKASRYEKNYPGKELRDLSAGLVAVLHDARRGVSEFEILFEKFLLGV